MDVGLFFERMILFLIDLHEGVLDPGGVADVRGTGCPNRGHWRVFMDRVSRGGEFIIYEVFI